MSYKSLKDLLGKYGQVDKLIMCTTREGKFKGVPTGEVIVWMTITSPIPSSLWVVESQTNMFLYYENQPLTCHTCGSVDHKAIECEVWKTTLPNERENAVNIDIDQEDLAGTNDPGAQSEVGDAINDQDNTHESSSKSTLSPESESESENENNEENVECEFVCTECDKKCKTGH